MKELRFVQARAKTSNPSTFAPNRKKRGLFLFGLWLIMGLTVAALIGPPIGRALAQSKLKLERFDTDIYPAIYVEHLPPLIARSDEIVTLEFNFICGYFREISTEFRPTATLYASYGTQQVAKPIALTEEERDGLRVLTTPLPASDERGQPLRYYLEVNDPQFDLTVRYPVKGNIELFVAPSFTPVELSEQKAVELGELVFALPWGDGPQEVGALVSEDYPRRIGPSALAVAQDGRIALLDHVNGRVLIFQPDNQSFTSLPITLPLKSGENLQFDREGQIAIFDPAGEQVGISKARVPQIYRLTPEGQVYASASVFVRLPAQLSSDLSVVDLTDNRLVVPFDDAGKAHAREAQEQKLPAELVPKYVTSYEARLADTVKGVAYQIRSISPLGVISFFERVSQGYLVVFDAEYFRAVWFDGTGRVVQDMTLPGEYFSEMNPYGQLAVDSQGALYVLNSTETGIQVRRAKAPY